MILNTVINLSNKTYSSLQVYFLTNEHQLLHHIKIIKHIYTYYKPIIKNA